MSRGQDAQLAEVVFHPRGRSSTPLLVHARPRESRDYLLYDSEPDAPSVYLHCKAAEQMRVATIRAVPNETIGVLLGRACRDERGVYTVVASAMVAIAEEFDGTRGAVRISAAGRSSLHGRASELHPTLEVVGWWHSHPHGAPRYSSVDLDEQATYPRAHHVGIVAAAEGYNRNGRPSDRHDPLGVYVGPRAIRLERAQRAMRPHPVLTGASEHSARIERSDRAGLPAVQALRRLVLLGAGATMVLLAAIVGTAFWTQQVVRSRNSLTASPPVKVADRLQLPLGARNAARSSATSLTFVLPKARTCQVGEHLAEPLSTSTSVRAGSAVVAADPEVVTPTYDARSQTLMIDCTSVGATAVLIGDLKGGILAFPVRVTPVDRLGVAP
jgi:proteasome lid subunit RPN8/RPN11